MAERIRAFDWTNTRLGPVERWSQAMRTALALCLGSRLCSCIYWGQEHLIIYNDAYSSILGAKHPSALGQPAARIWSEIFHIIGPLMEQTLTSWETTGSDDCPIFLNRSGYLEEFYCSFSYTPLVNESGEIEGVFAVLPETTTQVIGDRRLRTLQRLATSARHARTPEEALTVAANVLAQNPYDLPFVSMYLWDEKRRKARLCAVANIQRGVAAAPRVIRSGDAAVLARLVDAWRGKRIETLDVTEELQPLPAGGWPVPPRKILMLPLPAGQGAPDGFVIAGVSPYKELDHDYLTFFRAMADQITSSIAEAHGYQQEGARLRALAELDRAKTAFFSNVSHELRTPLTLILSPLEEIVRTEGGALPPEHRAALSIAHRNGLRLLKLVNGLMDFARIQGGSLQAEFEPTQLELVTAHLASSFEWLARKTGIDLVVDCEPLGEPVYVDRDMWDKIVLNLLSNAFKYTLTGEIRVTLHRVDNLVELTVCDTGCGIPRQHLPRIFERFYRVEDAAGRSPEGTGIGLALVKELAHHHRGTVAVESTVGQGSTFTVSLRLGAAHLPKRVAGRERSLVPTRISSSVYVEEAYRWRDDRSLGEISQQFERDSKPLPELQTAAKPRILLADDNADMREYLGRALAEHFIVEAVPDGDAALAAARRHRPDLVIADVMMPKLGGLEVLKELRSFEPTRTIPVLLLTARAAEESRIQGFEHGADDYLIKPFSVRELLARAHSAIKLAEVRSAVAQQQERLRIARDLHDTLLQSVQGMTLLLEAGLGQLEHDRERAAHLFQGAHGAAIRAAAEGRDVLALLRSSAPERHDLVESVTRLSTELLKRADVQFDIQAVGKSRELKPIVWNEMYAICREGIINSARHSGATRIRLEISYGEDLELSITDDGCGISPELVTHGRAGHFGLQGMRERATAAGGQLILEGGPAAGTRIRLTVPGNVAYEA